MVLVLLERRVVRDTGTGRGVRGCERECGCQVLRKEDCASSECGCDIVVNVVRPSQVSSPKVML